MELRGKVAVVTGAANGIGRACAARFVSEGAKVVVADLDGDATQRVAEEIGALGIAADVSVEADIENLVRRTEEEVGPIDLFHSNAGIAVGGGAETSNEEWQKIWEVNLMAHVYATRHVLPAMLDRGDGYLLSTASAAGLLTNIGAAPYSVTKHAAVALAEWLSITYGDRGIKVSCLCPQGVATNMLLGGEQDAGQSVVQAAAGVLQPEEVADAVVRGVRDETFLILPHPEVKEYFQRKANDYDRWIGGMRRLQARVRGSR
jgi:NAD(P)-dependent dehydrogenase (short-subunit alcohol dehydrogenase family)